MGEDQFCGVIRAPLTGMMGVAKMTTDILRCIIKSNRLQLLVNQERMGRPCKGVMVTTRHCF